MVNKTESLSIHMYKQVFLIVLIIAFSGCSVRQVALNSVADAFSSSSKNYASDNDIEFVGEAIPFGLKTMEGLLEEVPEHRKLLLAACRGYTQYAYAYIEQPSYELELYDLDQAYTERNRARLMYWRARDYCLRGISVNHPKIEFNNIPYLNDALANFEIEEVPLLYWTVAAWASAISLSKDDPGAVADLPVIEILIRKAYELDPNYDQGTLDVFFISYEMSQTGISEGSEARARYHFQRAVKLSGGKLAAPFVAYAESIAVANNDREEFETMLNRALAIDTKENPGNRLANLVIQRRANWLLANKDLYFLED